jgi:hypothetical protein
MQRKEVHRDAWKLWWANKRNIAFYLLLPACYMLLVWFSSDAGGWLASLIGVSGRTHKLFRAAAPLVLFVLCFVLGGAILQRYRFAPCVYRALRARGHGVCIRCGYWLRGLPDTSGRCPECGTERKVVGQDDVRQTPPAG